MRARGDEEDRDSSGSLCMDVRVEFTAKIMSVTCKQNSTRAVVLQNHHQTRQVRGSCGAVLFWDGRRAAARSQCIVAAHYGGASVPGRAGAQPLPVQLRLRTLLCFGPIGGGGFLHWAGLALVGLPIGRGPGLARIHICIHIYLVCLGVRKSRQ